MLVIATSILFNVCCNLFAKAEPSEIGGVREWWPGKCSNNPFTFGQTGKDKQKDKRERQLCKKAEGAQDSCVELADQDKLTADAFSG